MSTSFNRPVLLSSSVPWNHFKVILPVCSIFKTDVPIALGLDGSEISQQNFVLPSLQYPFTTLALELHYGKGFFIIRGLDPARYNPEENLLLFLGISSYIGDTRGRQDDMGNMICKR